jgi:serine/threonine-protein kinase
MELIEGRSLAARLRAEGRLPWREAVAITAAIADGLDAAHAVGVVHRDIKPDNVLLEDGGRVVITDFGIAAARASAGSGIAGTPAYMAPEQAAGEPPSAAADVYSVGVVLYEMLTGVPPWRGTTAEIFAARGAHEALELGALPDLEPAVADVVRRATARDPALRLRSAAELRGLLARWVDAAPAANRPARRRSDAAVRDLVVEAVTGDGERRHIADAVYEQVVARLSQVPRARVVTAWKTEQRASVACVVRIAEDGDAITVNACGTAGELVSLRLPATATEAAAGGIAAAAAIAASLGLADDESHPVATPPEALELYLQGRRLGRRLAARAILDALRLHERALALAPHDHRILAGHAMALARAVFVSKPDREPLDAAAAAAADAMVRAPERVETHIAAGQVALHQGDVVAAAGRLRHAIAIAPQAAEAHEWLGRLLLEAGHVDDGIARLETALSLDPRLELVQWEIARAAALEGDWDRYDMIARALIGDKRLNSTPWAARFASWRGDREGALAVLRASDPQDAQTGFGPEFFRRIGAAMTGAWDENRDALLAMAAAPGQASERRNSMIGQLVAEAAGGVGDIETCATALGHAMGHGFFDLHWLDKCPLLAKPRAAGVLDAMRPPVVARAQRILDALYGDSPSHNATADTMFATPSGDPTASSQSRINSTWR